MIHSPHLIGGAVALALAFPVAAQDTDTNVTNTEAPATVDMDAGAALDADSDVGELTDDFRTYPALISRMRAHASVDFPAANEELPVVVVRLSELGGDSTKGSADLKAEVAEQGENLEKIRAALEANENIRTQLEAEDVSAQSVVAISREVDGTLLVYVDDTASEAAAPSS